MLAYASHRRPRRRLSPPALVLILGGHALAIALVATARIDLGPLKEKVRTELVAVPLPPDPLPEPRPLPQPRSKPVPAPDSFVDMARPLAPLPDSAPAFVIGPDIAGQLPDIGAALEAPLEPPARSEPSPPPAEPVRVAARPVTSPDLLRPPYPESKRRSEEEAVLRLALTIDARGRVTAVEPVGPADPAFLAAARSHLLRHWRYRPATEDGRPVASTLTVTLRFTLEDE